MRFQKNEIFFKPTLHFNIWTSLVLTILRFWKLKGFIKGETICHFKIQMTLENLKKNSRWILNKPHFRGFDDLKMNKITRDALVSYNRNRSLTAKNTTKTPLYNNNKTKVFEILTNPYEGQKTHFYRSSNCAIQTPWENERNTSNNLQIIQMCKKNSWWCDLKLCKIYGNIYIKHKKPS